MRRVSVHLKSRSLPAGVLCALAVAAGLFMTGTSRADMTSWPAAAAAPTPTDLLPDYGYAPAVDEPPVSHAAASVDPLEAMQIVGWTKALNLSLAGHLPADQFPESLADDDTAAPSLPAAVELPPPPGSMTIALSGLAMFGAGRLLRQVRQIHLADIPEWYHAGAPYKVGGAVRLDLNTNRSLVPVCWYEPLSLVTSNRPVFYDTRQERRSRWESSYFIPTGAPRGPPALS